jgi:hypothetical protein
MQISKKISGTILLSLLVLMTSCTSSNSSKKPESTNSEKTSHEKLLEQKKPLFTDVFFADPSAHVFNNKLYIYPSHDIDSNIQPNDNGDQYDMKDYHVLSIDNFSSACVDNGEVLNLKDVPWAKRQLWAPDAAYKNGKYYLYFPAKDKEDIFRIGVATSSSPTGPFKAEENYIQGSFSMDPAVFTDDDNKSYMYFGGLWGGQLEKWKTGKFDMSSKAPEGIEPALGPKVATLSDDMLSFAETPQEVSIVDEDGNPILAYDEDRRFFEGVWVHKYNGNYYLSYSTGTTHYIAYAMSKNPKGPFTYKGKILNPVKGWTTHHSIVQYQDKWYLFYHDSSVSGVDYKRSVKYAELTYNSDGTINTIDP